MSGTDMSSKWNAGRCRSKIPAIALSQSLPWRKIDQGGIARCFHETTASAAEAIALHNCETIMIDLRLYLSARCPAKSERATTGTANTRPTRPSAVAECVRAEI